MVGAETAIVWDAHLGGTPVCSDRDREPQRARARATGPLDGPASWNGGTLFPLSSKKVARALNAASGNRPLVVLANLSGFDGSPESMRKLQLEYGAEIARAVVNFEGPIAVPRGVALPRRRLRRVLAGAQPESARGRARGLVRLGDRRRARGGGRLRARGARARLRRSARRRARAAPAHASERRPRASASNACSRRSRSRSRRELAAEFDAIHTVERARSVGSLSAILPPQELRAFLAREIGAASPRS